MHWTPIELVRLGLTVERMSFGGLDGDPLGSDGAVPAAETFVVGRFQIDV